MTCKMNKNQKLSAFTFNTILCLLINRRGLFHDIFILTATQIKIRVPLRLHKFMATSLHDICLFSELILHYIHRAHHIILTKLSGEAFRRHSVKLL